MSTYDERYPVGVQTVVAAGGPDYSKKQVNTRISGGWWIDTVKPCEVGKTLKAQAERYKQKYGQDVDKRYVK
jgi:hypothetical protein